MGATSLRARSGTSWGGVPWWYRTANLPPDEAAQLTPRNNPLRIVIRFAVYALGVLFVAATLLAIGSALQLDRHNVFGWFLLAACVYGSLVQVTVAKFVIPWTLGRFEA